MNKVTIFLEIEVPEEEIYRILPRIDELVTPSISFGAQTVQGVHPVQITQVAEERTYDGYCAPSAYSNGNPIELIAPIYHRKIYLS